MVNTAGLSSQVDGLFVRQAKGYDFAAWAHMLRLHPELFAAKIMYLTNDSVIGPIDQSEFSDVISQIRDSKADVIALTGAAPPALRVARPLRALLLQP